MTSIIIGISGGLLTILLVGIFRRLDKKIIYGLTLAGIGFLYVGFTWTDILSLIITSQQAIGIALIAYVGIKKNVYFLAAGYFLHGI